MTIVRSIRSVETFVSDELAVRRSSCLPTPNVAEQHDLSEAEEALAHVRDWKGIAFNWATYSILVTFAAICEGVFIACR